jgi:hypothetical protein
MEQEQGRLTGKWICDKLKVSSVFTRVAAVDTTRAEAVFSVSEMKQRHERTGLLSRIPTTHRHSQTTHRTEISKRNTLNLMIFRSNLSLNINPNCVLFKNKVNIIKKRWSTLTSKFLYFIPSPQYDVWTHHTFISSYNTYRLIKPSWVIFLLSLHYSSASIPTLTSVYILEYCVFSSM